MEPLSTHPDLNRTGLPRNAILEHAEEVFTIWVTQLSTTGQSDCAGDALIQEAAGQLRIMGVQTDVRLPDVILPGPDDKKKKIS